MNSCDVLSTVNSKYPSPDTILCVETAPALLQDQGAVFVRLLPLANAPTAEVQTTSSVPGGGGVHVMRALLTAAPIEASDVSRRSG